MILGQLKNEYRVLAKIKFLPSPLVCPVCDHRREGNTSEHHWIGRELSLSRRHWHSRCVSSSSGSQWPCTRWISPHSHRLHGWGLQRRGQGCRVHPGSILGEPCLRAHPSWHPSAGSTLSKLPHTIDFCTLLASQAPHRTFPWRISTPPCLRGRQRRQSTRPHLAGLFRRCGHLLETYAILACS